MKPSEKCKAAGLKSLADHIADEYGGNNSACARAYGVERNQVQQWLRAKKPVFVLDGALVNLIRPAPESGR